LPYAGGGYFLSQRDPFGTKSNQKALGAPEARALICPLSDLPAPTLQTNIDETGRRSAHLPRPQRLRVALAGAASPNPHWTNVFIALK